MNFSGGTGGLPELVLRQTRDAIETLPENWRRNVVGDASAYRG